MRLDDSVKVKLEFNPLCDKDSLTKAIEVTTISYVLQDIITLAKSICNWVVLVEKMSCLFPLLKGISKSSTKYHKSSVPSSKDGNPVTRGFSQVN